MARNTAQQGAAFERRVIALLEEYGYTCIRSAASKGAVDIVAVGGFGVEDGQPVLFIQCKLSNPVIPPAERRALRDVAQRAGALPLVAWWQTSEATGFKNSHFRRLTDVGPKDWVPWAPA